VSVVSPLSPISQNYFPTYNLLSHVVFYLLVFRRQRRILSSFAPFLMCYPRQWTRMTNTCFMYSEAIFVVSIECIWPCVSLSWILNTVSHVSVCREYWTQLNMCPFILCVEYNWPCVNLLCALHTVGHISVCCEYEYQWLCICLL